MTPAGPIGIVGVGNMGGGMAARLLQQGWGVRACDLVSDKVQALVRAGATPAATPAEAAAGAGALIVCVVDAAQCEDVLFGADGAAAALAPRTPVLLCPTIAPQDAEGLAARLAATGALPIDAPMSGGPARAREGSMSLMVACSDEAFAAAAALLATLSGKLFRVGTNPGDGAKTKLVNNLLAGITWSVRPRRWPWRSAWGWMRGEPGRDRTIQRPELDRLGPPAPRHRGDLEPRAHMTLLRKDTALAIEAAQRAGFQGPLGAAARTCSTSRQGGPGRPRRRGRPAVALARMTTLLVVEDDDAIRANIARLLKLEGFEILAAVNGAMGLQRARESRPDIVISDIGMPEMDGFALLEAIRADAQLASTPVLLLTALDDRASMRRGMTAGADDYLAKPFTRVELLEALQGLLRRKGRLEQSIEQAVHARESHLRRAFTESLAGRKLPDKFGLEAPPGVVADEALQGVVLFADIRDFTLLAEKLGSAEVAELLSEYFGRCCEPVLRQGGGNIKFIGDGMLAVFAQDANLRVPAARRAISAALGLALAAHDFRAWLARRFEGRGLPPLAVGIGLHQGEVRLCRVGTPDAREVTAIGEPVNVAARLEAASKELGWTVVASSELLAAAGEGVQTGGMTSLAVRGPGDYLDAAHITGLDAAQADVPDARTLAMRAADLATAVQVNSEITARAVKGALESRLSALKTHTSRRARSRCACAATGSCARSAPAA